MLRTVRACPRRTCGGRGMHGPENCPHGAEPNSGGQVARRRSSCGGPSPTANARSRSAGCRRSPGSECGCCRRHRPGPDSPCRLLVHVAGGVCLDRRRRSDRPRCPAADHLPHASPLVERRRAPAGRGGNCSDLRRGRRARRPRHPLAPTGRLSPAAALAGTGATPAASRRPSAPARSRGRPRVGPGRSGR
jgi:hypothetical protein